MSDGWPRSKPLCDNRHGDEIAATSYCARVRLAQLSDTHLLADPDAELWGHNPARNLDAVLNALPSPVDALVVTGDVADSGERESYRLASKMTEGRAPYRCFVAGNHDDPAVMREELGPVDGVRVMQAPHWSLVLVNTQWDGHDAGRVTEPVLAQLRAWLADVTTHVALFLHHPPMSPCPKPECGLVDGDLVVDAITEADTPVRVVCSGHVHRRFVAMRGGVTFLGAPSTFRQLHHGGEPHYRDSGEPPGGLLLDLADDGAVTWRVVTATARVASPHEPRR